jgi:hypothetical protein
LWIELSIEAFTSGLFLFIIELIEEFLCELQALFSNSNLGITLAVEQLYFFEKLSLFLRTLFRGANKGLLLVVRISSSQVIL